MKALVISALSLLTGLGAGLSVQDKVQDKKQDKAPAAGDHAMEMPKPGKEHASLAKMAGTWDAVVKFPGGEAKGTAIWKMMDGGFWLVDEFKADMMGMPFVGHGMTGFDTSRGKFVAFWCDSMSPCPNIMWGTHDEKTGTTSFSGENANHEGKLVKQFSTQKASDADHLEFKLWEEGKEAEAMVINYTRRK